MDKRSQICGKTLICTFKSSANSKWDKHKKSHTWNIIVKLLKARQNKNL